IFGFRLLNHSVAEVAGLPILNLTSSPITGVNWLVKAAEDRVLAFLIFLLILPLMVIIAAAIKLDSIGPVYFRQKRHGWDGKEITILKFRTMVVHQEVGGRL